MTNEKTIWINEYVVGGEGSLSRIPACKASRPLAAYKNENGEYVVCIECNADMEKREFEVIGVPAAVQYTIPPNFIFFSAIVGDLYFYYR